MYVYVLNFAKASPSSIAVIRPFSRGGCLQKTSRIKYICHVQWKVPIDKAKVQNVVVIMTLISFCFCCRLSTPFHFCKSEKKKKKKAYRIYALDMCNANNLCHQFHSQSLKIKNYNYNNNAQNGKSNLTQS